MQAPVIEDIIKGVALIGAGGLALRFLPERYSYVGLIPVAGGIYFIAKPFLFPKEYEDAQPGEEYEVRILQPEPYSELKCWYFWHTFQWCIKNPYNKPKKLYTALAFYHADADRYYWTGMGPVHLDENEECCGLYDYKKFNCTDNLGDWEVAAAAFYKKDDYTSIIGQSDWVPFKVVL